MSKSNDSSKLGRAPQVRELRDDELQEVSGGYTFTDVMVDSVVARGTVGGGHKFYDLLISSVAIGWSIRRFDGEDHEQEQ